MHKPLALLTAIAILVGCAIAFFDVRFGPPGGESRATTLPLEPGTLTVFVELDGVGTERSAPLDEALDALARSWYPSPEAADRGTLERGYGESTSLFTDRAHALAVWRLPDGLDGAAARAQLLDLFAREFPTAGDREAARVHLRWRPRTPADALHQEYALSWDDSAWSLVGATG